MTVPSSLTATVYLPQAFLRYAHLTKASVFPTDPSHTGTCEHVCIKRGVQVRIAFLALDQDSKISVCMIHT